MEFWPTKRLWNPLLRYSSAVLLVALATVLTLVMWQAGLSRNPHALFFAAVMLASWMGGLGPGLLTTALAVWTLDYLFLPSFDPLFPGWGDLLNLASFALVAILISSLTARNQQSLEEADAANRAKDRFLAVLSHELRTPLTPALAAAADLEKNPHLSQDIREDLRLIRRNMELEARLIDDLLDITRIHRGKLDLNRKVIDLHVLIEEALDVLCRQDLEQKRLNLRLDLAARQPFADVDSARIQQVLWNLLRNAIKFSPPEGEILIRTESTPDGWVHVHVTDNGIGIAPEMLARIFEPFEQVSNGQQHYGGLGLGLAISRALMEAHGGSLTAFSQGSNRGCTMTLGLPVASRSGIWPELARGGAPATVRPLRLLLVEDHADTARITARLLRQANHQVRTASSIADALEAAKHDRYDLVISDLGLPDGTGFDLMQQLRQRHDLPGIAVSGYGMEEDVRRSREAGFIAHITKPIDFQNLQQTIQRIASE